MISKRLSYSVSLCSWSERTYERLYDQTGEGSGKEDDRHERFGQA